MSKPFSPYERTDLPDGFRYPATYLVHSTGDYPEMYPWWFVDSKTQAGESFYNSIFLPERKLIPFAKTDIDDDIACFDGADNTRDPAIVMVTSSLDRSYGFKNYDSWFTQALTDKAKFTQSRA